MMTSFNLADKPHLLNHNIMFSYEVQKYTPVNQIAHWHETCNYWILLNDLLLVSNNFHRNFGKWMAKFVGLFVGGWIENMFCSILLLCWCYLIDWNQTVLHVGLYICRIFHNDCLCMESKASLKSMKLIRHGNCWSRHFSMIWFRLKIWSWQDLPFLKPAWFSRIFWSTLSLTLRRRIEKNTLPDTSRRAMPRLLRQ